MLDPARPSLAAQRFPAHYSLSIKGSRSSILLRTHASRAVSRYVVRIWSIKMFSKAETSFGLTPGQQTLIELVRYYAAYVSAGVLSSRLLPTLSASHLSILFANSILSCPSESMRITSDE